MPPKAIASRANTANVVNANQDTGGVRSIFDKLFRRPKVMTEKERYASQLNITINIFLLKQKKKSLKK